MSDLFIEAWGTGAPVVLVHGSLATGAEEWQAQQPLAEEGYQLLVLDRRGYGESPAVEGEDFLRDAADIAHVIGDGAHVVALFESAVGAEICFKTSAPVMNRWAGSIPVRLRSYIHVITGERYPEGMTIPAVIHSDPGILGGTPVFVGTRVPLRNLVDYLEAGHGLDYFLEQFPTVSREQAVAALESAHDALTQLARSS